MKNINVISWGGGTQSTALLLMMLENNAPIDYIIFADTGDESAMTYNQIYKVQKYVEDHYNREIILTKKGDYILSDQEVIDMVKRGETDGRRYRSSNYSDLYQNQVLFYQGFLDRTDLVPHWVINAKGEIGKLTGRQCTLVYKITQIKG